MIVALSELTEALNRTTKMKRAPAGARSDKLKEGAFVPELTGFRVEMPGGSSLVNVKSGKLDKEIVFEARLLIPIAKVLGTYRNEEDVVIINVTSKDVTFRCGTSRLTIPIM